MPAVQTLIQYRQLTGQILQSDENAPLITALNQNLQQMLSNDSSPFLASLRTLSEKKQARLVAALLIADGNAIYQQLLPLVKSHLPLRQITALLQLGIHKFPAGSRSKQWLNDTVTRLVSALLTTNTAASNTVNKSKRILQQAMQSIPDSCLSIKAKVQICREIDYSAANMITDYSYHEPLVQLSSPRFSGDLSDNEFIQLLKCSNVTHSEFILICRGYLQKKFIDEDGVSLKLDEIAHLFLMVRYEEAISKISGLIESHQDKLTPKAYRLFNRKLSELKNDVINKNHPRRFFENRLYQLCHLSQAEIASISGIALAITGQRVKTQDEAELAVLCIAENSDAAIKQRYIELINQSELFPLYDRLDKTGISDKDMESKGFVLSEAVYSRNGGILLSYSPNYVDELSSETMRNKIVDITSTFEDPDYYSYSRPRQSFVGSLSGHTFLVIANLEKYMQTHSTEPDLQKKINHFFKMMMLAYINKAYHGLFEIIDVLTEKHITQLFQKYHVTIDLSWLKSLSTQACKDAQTYTLSHCMRKQVNAAIIGLSPLFKQPKKRLPTTEQQAAVSDMSPAPV